MRRLLTASAAALCLIAAAPPGASAAADNGTRASVAWALGYTGAGQTVAIIDQGTNTGHPWFANDSIAVEGCITQRGTFARPLCDPVPDGPGVFRIFGPGVAMPRDAEGRINKRDNHGTVVTGAAVGASAWADGFPRGPRGIAPDAKAITIKYTVGLPDGTVTGRLETIAEALEWLAAEQRTRPLAAVSMSFDVRTFGAGIDPTIERGSCDRIANRVSWPHRISEAISSLVRQGVVVVATAPNDPQDQVGFPACLSDVIAVGAVNQAGWLPPEYPSWPAIDVLASGIDLTLPLANGTTGRRTGASYATSTVAGAIALYRQAHPRATRAQIVSRLLSTGKRIRLGRGVTRRVLQVDEFLGIRLPSGELRPDCLQPHFRPGNGTMRAFFRLTCAPSAFPLQRLAVTVDGPGGTRESEDLNVRPRPIDFYQDNVVTVGPPAGPGGPGGYRLCALLYTAANQIWPARTVCHDYEV